MGGGIHDEGPIGSRVQREGKECCSEKKLANSTAVPHRMRERVDFSLSGFVSNFLSLHVGHQRVLCEMGE